MMTNTSAGIEPVAQEEPEDDTKVTIEKLLGWEEGYCGSPYHCSEGYVTYGIGHRLSSIKDDSLCNYSDMWISREDAEHLLRKDLRKLHGDIGQSSFVIAYDELSNDRQVIIESMVYQMGIAGVAGFHQMWKDIRDGDFVGAGDEMRDSLWREQTPERAERHAQVMITGDLKFVYGAYLS